jgi:N-acetylmuramoyl-L-alanine amidase
MVRRKQEEELSESMKKIPALISLCACAFGVMGTACPASAQSLQQGTQSEQVLDMQEKLSELGYFHVGTTGYYGAITAKSLKAFQRDHGLAASGAADSNTLSKLGKSVPSSRTVLEQMARVIYSEARGESFQGQVAVGAVVLNRVQSERFPDSITEVIFQPGQFSSVDDGQYHLSPDTSAYRAASKALNGTDPTNGALFYYNPDIATSSWSKERTATTTIGNHVFTK